MRKSALIFAISTMLMAGTASATVTLLTGTIHLINPGASWNAPHTAQYNAVYNTMAQCEQALTEAETKIPKILPVSREPMFKSFSKVSTLTCTYK